MRLSIKLATSFSIIILIAFTINLYFSLSTATDELKAAIGSDLQGNSEYAAAAIDGYIEERIVDLKLISSTPILHKEDLIAINNYLAKVLENSKDYSRLDLLNLEGKIIASSSANAVGSLLVNEKPHLVPFFDQAKKIKEGEVLFHEGHYNEKTNQILMNFFTPIITNSKITGILFSTLDINRFKNLVSSLNQHIKGDNYFLVNREGKTLVAGDVNAKLFELSPDAKVNTSIKEIMMGTSNGYIIYKNYKGENVIAGFADLNEHGFNKAGNWEIFSSAPVSEVLAPVYKLRTILLIVTGITLLLTVLLAFLIANVITKPIKLIVKRINEIASASGDLTLTIPVNSKDELGDLAIAFNKMTASIRNLISLTLNIAERVSVSSQQLSASAQQMSSSTQEIATTVQQIAKGSQNQATQVEETTKILEQLNLNVGQVASSSKASAATSIKATEVAEKGDKAMQGTVVKMNKIYETVTHSTKAVQTLSARSEQIGTIVNVITNIADQTNLLALNAAIEAARAGEAGRGFAVVADEVRKLAEGSAKAADQISELIIGIQKETQVAVKSMEAGSAEVREGREIAVGASEALQEIILTVEKTAGSIQEIATSAEQIAEGTERVVKSIDDVASTAEQAAAGAEQAGAATEEMSAGMQQIAASSEELSEMASTLRDTVKQFKISKTNEAQRDDSQFTGGEPHNIVSNDPQIPDKFNYKNMPDNS